MKVLVTGGNGHVARALIARLSAESGWTLRAAVRTAPALPTANCEYVQVGDLASPEAALNGIAAGCDVVVHTAARVHVMDERSADADLYRPTNVDATLRLAREAVRSGVRRFVFLSTVKVNGESTPPGKPFLESDVPNPQGAYALSKWEAECGLVDLCAQNGLEWVIIRPPLVYGPGVRANFQALASAVERGMPLPLGAVRNLRSFVAIGNLVDFIRVCMQHPAAANQTFLVSDGHDLSTAELVRRMGQAIERPARVPPVPVWMLRTAGILSGRQLMVRRLLENLQVDISKARELLGWEPPVAVQEGLRRALRPTAGS